MLPPSPVVDVASDDDFLSRVAIAPPPPPLVVPDVLVLTATFVLKSAHNGAVIAHLGEITFPTEALQALLAARLATPRGDNNDDVDTAVTTPPRTPSFLEPISPALLDPLAVGLFQ